MSGLDIAVVGMSCVFPRARNLKEYWGNLVNGVDAVTELPADRWQGADNFERPPTDEAWLPKVRGGYLPSGLSIDPQKYGVLPNAVKHSDPGQFIMLQLVDLALEDANVASDSPLREMTDLIVGQGGYPLQKHSEFLLRAEHIGWVMKLLDQFDSHLLNGRRSEVEEFLRSKLPPDEVENVGAAIPNLVASRTANRLNLHGAAYTVDAACASSLIAVEAAVDRLRNGDCELAVAAGIFLTQTPTFWHVFQRLGVLSPSGRIRPFDQRADGLLIGEGGGAVVLKRADDARRDGDRVYAVIKGIGSSSDGRDVDLLAPSSKGQVQALQRAYADSGVDPQTIGYLEMHGTGTKAGDTAEIQTVKTFFGTSAAYPTQRCMGSVKSMIGHTMPASGMASLIKVCLMLSNKVIPPTLNCTQPREDLLDAPFYINSVVRPWVHDSTEGPRRAGVNLFGFGGINSHVVVEEVSDPAAVSTTSDQGTRPLLPRPIQFAAERPTELVAFSATTPAQLARSVDRLSRFLQFAASDVRLADVAVTVSRDWVSGHPCQLSIICASLDELRDTLRDCAARLSRDDASWQDLKHVYYTATCSRPSGKIAFIFPGMGFPGLIGDYPDHIRELALHYPEVRNEFDVFEGRDRHPEDPVLTSSIFWPPESLPEDFRLKLKERLAPVKSIGASVAESGPLKPGERYLAAMGITLCNWVSWLLLKRFEIPVDMLAGQSQGEMAALCMSGVCGFRETAPGYWKALNVDWGASIGECMVFCWTKLEPLLEILKDFPESHIAIYHTHDSHVLAGPNDQMSQIEARLRERRDFSKVLPYPPIHTPRLSYLRADLKDAMLSGTILGKPKIPLYSSITTWPYPDDADGIRETMFSNIDNPLRTWETLHHMYDAGARVFVQAGGGQIATNLDMQLPKGAEFSAFALDLETVNPITQLNHFCAGMIKAGVPMTILPLFEGRDLRQLDLDSAGPAVAARKRDVAYRMDWSPFSLPVAPAIASDSMAPIATTAAVLQSSPQPSAQSLPEAAVEKMPSVVAEEVPTATISQAPPASELSALANDEVSCSEELGETALEAAGLETGGMPFIGRIVEWEPERFVRFERRLDLDRDLFLRDHLFVHAEGVKPVQECKPIMPMTFSMELMAEAAALLCPGLGLIGFENIRAARWIGVREGVDPLLDVRAELSHVQDESARRISVTVKSEGITAISATVLFADVYPDPMPLDLVDSRQDPAWPITAEQVYTERHMFHGPSLQCISRLTTFGNPGFSAELQVMPKDVLFSDNRHPTLLTDPCLNDGIGQLVGLWLQLQHCYVLPTGIERIEFYGPTPAEGLSVPIRGEFTAIDSKLKRTLCNLEIEDGAGGLWVRIVGWSDWMFNVTPACAEWIRTPHKLLLAQELSIPEATTDSACCYIERHHVRISELERASLTALSREELTEMHALEDDLSQYRFLLSRIAAKDALRLWIARQTGNGEIHPAAFVIRMDASGRPMVDSAGAWPIPYLSLATTASGSIAIAGAAEMEVHAEPRNASLPAEDLMLTAAEIDLVDSLEPSDSPEAWRLRLWCAKLAATKLPGGGERDQPIDWEAIDVEPDGHILLRHVRDRQSVSVMTALTRDLVVAYASGSYSTKPGHHNRLNSGTFV